MFLITDQRTPCILFLITDQRSALLLFLITDQRSALEQGSALELRPSVLIMDPPGALH